MNISVEDLKKLLLANSEHEHLEFKEAKEKFNFEIGKHSLLGYCFSFANERGGKLILGITDKKPRKIVGTKAFQNIKKIEKKINEVLGRKIVAQELFVDQKRVLIFHISSRPIAEAIPWKGRFLKRFGDEIVDMNSEDLREIQDEAIPDFSATFVKSACFDDLDPKAIQEMRKLFKKSGRVDKEIELFNDEQLLTDLNLIDGDKVTVAALVLLGTERSLTKYIPCSEIRYGYRVSASEDHNQDSQIFRKAYLIYQQEIWEKINSRNLIISIPRGFVLEEKKVFDSNTIREAINNAIIHRDYAEQESIVVIQTNSMIRITNPGGLLEGITIKNIADRTKTRNKLIADILHKCSLVESFGDGVNLMIKHQISQGKDYPDFSKTTKYNVCLEIDGRIKDFKFTQYVYKISHELGKDLNEQELTLLYGLRNSAKQCKKEEIRDLESIGIIEKSYGNKYMLAKKYYLDRGKKGKYTRIKGMGKKRNKEFILEHLRNYPRGHMNEFREVLKDLEKPTINKYLGELRDEGEVELVGNPKISRGKNRAYWQLKS